MNRRHFLSVTGLGTATGLASLTPVGRAEVTPPAPPRPVSAASLEITDLRVARLPTGLTTHVIRLDTNQGISGYGEIRDGASPTYALMLKRRILGENPCHVDKIFRKLKQFGGHARQAGGVVAIEMACWDLAGKVWGVPCWQMLGGKFRDRVRLYADTPTTPDPVELGRRLRRRREQGYTFLKMDVGVDLLRRVEDGLSYPAPDPADPTPRMRYPAVPRMLPHPFTGIRITEKGVNHLVEYVRQVREEVGWDIPLAADHFGHIGIEDAIKLARALDPLNLAWLEDMVPWFYTDQYVRLRHACTTPILTGEDIYLKEGFLPLFEQKAIAICHPDPMTAGGLLETKKIGDLAMEHGIAMALHMAGSPVGLLGSVHCAAATENFMVLEHHDVDTPHYEDLVQGLPKPIVKDGFAAVPDGPGLGLELNEEAILEHLRRRGLDPREAFFPPSDRWNDERSWDRHWSRLEQQAAESQELQAV